jgi:hypothetical protein
VSRSKRPTDARDDAEKHPIAWFSALLRGVDRDDQDLIDRAVGELEQLGYFVVPMPPRNPERAGAGRR